LYNEIDDACSWCHCFGVVSEGLSPAEKEVLASELDLMF
jgi:hypothetical protein